MLGAVLFYILQQGTEYSLLESEVYPDLEVPKGERRKVVKGTFPTREVATEKGEAMAKLYHGTWKG